DRTYLYLMKLADGKTLTFNGTVDVEGFTPISKSYQNDAKTATFTMSHRKQKTDACRLHERG
ncbi:MAG: hypothetical protein MSA50_04565, partial [Veillonellaceae bacterium]|nr:hypothetical protein [Veillonellaceae bacterium]